jgi:DNA-binding CsgD family transcriptional regulator
VKLQYKYFCADIPAPAPRKYFSPCVYSDSGVMHCMSQSCVAPLIEKAGLSAAYKDAREWPRMKQPDDSGTPGAIHALSFPLRPRHGEFALVGMTAAASPQWGEQKQMLSRELRILADYFHGHVLRIYGHASERDILVTAQELDCLKWTAAGKTAWEASVILGISERTVRFHLNMAREKLNCATTTQAVAKAVSNHLIEV